MGFITEKTILFQGSRGDPTFSRGVQLFPGGDQMLISIETHITCDFQVGGGEVRTPYPPSGSAHAAHLCLEILQQQFEFTCISLPNKTFVSLSKKLYQNSFLLQLYV